MSDRDTLKKELKKDAQLFWTRVKSGAVKFASTLSVMTPMLGAPQMAGATERGDNPDFRDKQEYFDKYRRTVEYQVDTVSNNFGTTAFFSPDANMIMEQYEENAKTPNNSSRSSIIAHEVNHKDIHMNKLIDASMSLEQKYKASCHNEISSYIVTVMQVRQEYLGAKSDEERKEIMEANPFCNFYFKALDEGKITNKHANVEEFDAEMSFIANKMQKMFMGSVEAGGAYDKTTAGHVKIYFSEHDYDYIQQNDENYNAFMEYAYNIGGVDFRKYFDDIKCPNESIIKADEMIRNNVPRAIINDTIMSNEDRLIWESEREDAFIKQEMHNDFASFIKSKHEPMSLEQAVMLDFDSKRAEKISQIIEVKNKYFEAGSDEEREEIAKGLRGYDVKEYYKSLMDGKIDTVKDKLSKDDLNYINDMLWIINSNDCADKALEHYLSHKDNAVRNDENFLKERSSLYTFGGVDYSSELNMPAVNVTGLNIIQADEMIKNNASYEEVSSFLEQSKGEGEVFYVKGEVNQELSPLQQMKIEEHRLFLQNIMCRYGYGKTENFAKSIDNYIEYFKNELKNTDERSNYLQTCLDIVSKVEKDNIAKDSVASDNDDLYKQELAKVYTVNGVNIMEHISGSVEDALPSFVTLDNVKEEALSNIENNLQNHQGNTSENDAQYYRYKETEDFAHYGDPMYLEWSENCRVSGVQQIEIYDFKSNILKEQRNLVELSEDMANSVESSQKFDKKVDERADSVVVEKSVVKDSTNVKTSARLNVYEL